MRINNAFYYGLASILLISTQLAGCKKSGVDKSTVSFTNQLDEEVTLYIYGSKADYGSNSNPIHKTSIPAGDVGRFPGDDFVNGRTYYMDWFTSDYYYHNWYNDDFPVYGNRVRFSPEDGNNTYYIQKSLKGDNRKTFLNGESASTTWIAIGAFLYSNSIGYSNQWNTLTDNERFKKVTINKDGSADYTFRDNSGTIINQELPLMIHESKTAFIEFKDSEGNTLGNMTGGKLPTSTQPNYASNSTDTVMALFPDNEYIFMMLKQ